MLAKTSVRKRFAVRRGEGVEFKGRKKSLMKIKKIPSDVANNYGDLYWKNYDARE